MLIRALAATLLLTTVACGTERRPSPAQDDSFVAVIPDGSATPDSDSDGASPGEVVADPQCAGQPDETPCDSTLR